MLNEDFAERYMRMSKVEELSKGSKGSSDHSSSFERGEPLEEEKLEEVKY
jgi:hypothetical protein